MGGAMTKDEALASALVALTPGETLVVMGRCPVKGCRHGVRVDVPGITVLPTGFGYGNSYPAPRGFECPDGCSWVGTMAALRHPEMYWPGVHVCPVHDEHYRFARLLAGHSSADCSADCTEATGADCKCSCGGANHGVDAR